MTLNEQEKQMGIERKRYQYLKFKTMPRTMVKIEKIEKPKYIIWFEKRIKMLSSSLKKD